MIRATWNGGVVAESDETVVVEGNHYFPPEALDRRYLRESETHTRCAWKGTASYYHLVVDGEENRDAAWYYPDPSPAARTIAGRVAFWRGVTVERVAARDAQHQPRGREGNRRLLARASGAEHPRGTPQHGSGPRPAPGAGHTGPTQHLWPPANQSEDP